MKLFAVSVMRYGPRHLKNSFRPVVSAGSDTPDPGIGKIIFFIYSLPKMGGKNNSEARNSGKNYSLRDLEENKLFRNKKFNSHKFSKPGGAFFRISHGLALHSLSTLGSRAVVLYFGLSQLPIARVLPCWFFSSCSLAFSASAATYVNLKQGICQ